MNLQWTLVDIIISCFKNGNGPVSHFSSIAKCLYFKTNLSSFVAFQLTCFLKKGNLFIITANLPSKHVIKLKDEHSYEENWNWKQNIALFLAQESNYDIITATADWIATECTPLKLHLPISPGWRKEDLRSHGMYNSYENWWSLKTWVEMSIKLTDDLQTSARRALTWLPYLPNTSITFISLRFKFWLHSTALTERNRLSQIVPYEICGRQFLDILILKKCSFTHGAWLWTPKQNL